MKRLVRFSAGDSVFVREPPIAPRMRTHYLRDARVETVSECGRYLTVSGVRAWGKNRLRFSVMAADVRHHKPNTVLSETETKQPEA